MLLTAAFTLIFSNSLWKHGWTSGLMYSVQCTGGDSDIHTMEGFDGHPRLSDSWQGNLIWWLLSRKNKLPWIFVISSHRWQLLTNMCIKSSTCSVAGEALVWMDPMRVHKAKEVPMGAGRTFGKELMIFICPLHRYKLMSYNSLLRLQSVVCCSNLDQLFTKLLWKRKRSCQM